MKNSLLGLYEKSMPSSLSLEQKLKTASQFGFDFVEMSVDETEDKLSRLKWSQAERGALVSAM